MSFDIKELTEIDLESADFSDALMWLKEGKRVARKGWNGKGQFCWMVPEGQYPARTEAIKGHFPGDMVPYGSYFALKNAQDAVVPWQPSVGDLLATDWAVINHPQSESAYATKVVTEPNTDHITKLLDIPEKPKSIVFKKNKKTNEVVTAFYFERKNKGQLRNTIKYIYAELANFYNSKGVLSGDINFHQDIINENNKVSSRYLSIFIMCAIKWHRKGWLIIERNAEGDKKLAFSSIRATKKKYEDINDPQRA